MFNSLKPQGVKAAQPFVERYRLGFEQDCIGFKSKARHGARTSRQANRVNRENTDIPEGSSTTPESDGRHFSSSSERVFGESDSWDVDINLSWESARLEAEGSMGTTYVDEREEDHAAFGSSGENQPTSVCQAGPGPDPDSPGHFAATERFGWDNRMRIRSCLA